MGEDIELKSIHQMKILIEKEDALKVKFDNKKPYPILLDFDNSKNIGYGTVFIEDGKMYANITLNRNINGYPAIGYTRNAKKECSLFAIGISTSRNEDESIPKIIYKK